MNAQSEIRSPRRLSRALAGALLVGAALVTMSAAPAQAAPATNVTAATVTPMDASCAAGDLCFWVDKNKGGARGHLSGSNTHWSTFAQSQCDKGTWNDCASSIYNHGSHCQARIWEDAGYRGASIILAKEQTISDLSTRDDGLGLFDDWEDTISSNDWVNCN